MPQTTSLTHPGKSRSASVAAQPTEALLAAGLARRRARLSQPDMASSDEAAALAGTNRETANRWLRAGHCIGLDRTVRGWRLPRRQFEPSILKRLPAIARALRTTEGWALLMFLETPHEALDGRTPRMALEQGEAESVIDLAGSEGTAER